MFGGVSCVQALGLGFSVLGFWSWVFGLGCLVLSLWSWVLDFRSLVLSFLLMIFVRGCDLFVRTEFCYIYLHYLMLCFLRQSSCLVCCLILCSCRGC